jgi:UDP-glucose:(heptosyl)LPS alpha-1,3-glucosyltransferase
MITLIKSTLFKQGGLEKYTWQIAKAFCALGIPVRVLTTGTISHSDDPLLDIVSLPVHSPLSFLNVLQFDKACSAYLAAHPTEVIFSLDRNRFQTHLRSGNGVHAAYLQQRASEEGLLKKYSFHLNPLHRAILSLEKKAFEHPELKVLFTNSEMVKQQILAFYSVDPQKIVAIHNGVEWEAMQQPFDNWESESETHKRTYNLDPTAFQFLFLGHNFLRKGLAKLLHALSHLKTEHFQLNVVGKEKNLSYFQALSTTLGLQNKVLFHGPQADPIPFYQSADCTVIPSLYDPFANVTVESLAMGVPVISSKHNGGHEILTPSNGAVIESLTEIESFSSLLKSALYKKKTPVSAKTVRSSVKHLDFSLQLKKTTEIVLKP